MDRAGNVGYSPDGYCVVLSTKCGKSRRHIHTTREDGLTYGMAKGLPKGMVSDLPKGLPHGKTSQDIVLLEYKAPY